MYTIEMHVGRLVESVMRGKVTREEIEAANKIAAELTRTIQGRCVVIADYRATKFLMGDEAELIVQTYRRVNSRIERSAVLVSASSAVGVLQTERMIRESQHPARRAFRDPHEAAAWLGEVLTPEERARLHVVLGLP
jgi:hypothetical protein